MPPFPRIPGRRPDPLHGAPTPARLLHSLLLAGLVAGCGSGSDPADPDPDPPPVGSLRLVEVVSGLAAPVALTTPSQDPRLFVVEQAGRIRVLKDGALLATPFLDIRDRVRDGGERGLLGLAFHPDYASNGLFYVNYTDNGGATQVARYRARTDDPDRADPGSERILLTVSQPFGNHNGGHLAFGPDGMLWIGMGDGGSAGDPGNEGQDRSTLLGALLRLDVDGGDPYRIPPDNPYAGGGGRGEIWATGLRNPWRWSFDRSSGLLYLADVGQNRWEEVNVAPAATPGVNYGWRTMEGPDCFNPSSGCNRTGLHLPVLSYGHDEGCSVTGGVVYRGQDIPGLVGHYLYGDFCGGWVRSFRLDGDTAADREERFTGVGNVVSFGEDRDGEVHILTGDGRVLRIAPSP